MKKVLSIILALVIMTGLFAGCGSNQDSSSSTTSAGGTAKVEETKATEAKPVEITWWEYPNFGDIPGAGPGSYEKYIIEKFNQKNPNIKINVEMLAFNGGPDRVAAAIASNSQADFVYDFPGRIIQYARAEKMAKLNDMFTDEFKNDIPKTIADACRIGEDYYMYPFNTAPNMMVFNKDMMEKAGLLDLLPLNKPDRLWTVEEYVKCLRAIKEKIPGVIPAMVFAKTTGGDQGTRALFSNLYGGATINPELTEYQMNKPETVKAIEFVVKGIDEGLFAKGAEGFISNDSIDMFIQGKAASGILYNAVLGKTYAAKKNFKEVYIPIPSPTKPALEAFIGGVGVFDNGDADKVAAAKKFIDYMFNDPETFKNNVKATGGLSVKTSVKNLYDDEELQFNEKMVPYIGTYYNQVPGFAEMRNIYIAQLQQIFAGKITPQAGMDEFVAKANTTLKQ